jgi:hypothetical protein
VVQALQSLRIIYPIPSFSQCRFWFIAYSNYPVIRDEELRDAGWKFMWMCSGVAVDGSILLLSEGRRNGELNGVKMCLGSDLLEVRGLIKSGIDVFPYSVCLLLLAFSSAPLVILQDCSLEVWKFIT